MIPDDDNANEISCGQGRGNARLERGGVDTLKHPRVHLQHHRETLNFGVDFFMFACESSGIAGANAASVMHSREERA